MQTPRITPTSKKKPPYNPEIIFRDQNHLISYLVGKFATNRNKKSNIKLKM
jgi:hypothetical protein